MINDASLVMIPSGYKDGKLYSVKPTDGSGDFTFSRGSNLAATRVNSEGLIEKGRENLLLQSNTFNTTWFNSNSTETSGQSGYDGSNNAWEINISAGSAFIGQNTSYNGLQTFSVYAKAGTLNFCRVHVSTGPNSFADFNLSNGSVGTTQNCIDTKIDLVGNGWYRLSITFSANASSYRFYPIQADNDLTATSGNIYIQDSQTEVGLVATDYIETTTTTAQAGILEDMPRLNYGTCPSLLLEPQRTNLVTQSEYFGGSYWTKTATTTEMGFLSPEGNLNAYKLLEDNTNSIHRIYQTSTITASPSATFSVYVKYNGRRFVLIRIADAAVGQWYDIENGVLGGSYLGAPDNSTIEPVGNDWYRITASNSISNQARLELWVSDTQSVSAYQGDTSKGVYLYGGQIEVGSYPTSYIPTYGASVTRGTDSCSKTGISSLIGQTEGTLFADFEIDADNTNGYNRVLAVGDGTSNNRIFIFAQNTEVFRFYVANGGAAQVDIVSTTSILGGRHKVAFGYKANDFIAYVDGVQVGTDTNGTVPTCSNLYIGTSETGSNQPLEGGLNQAILFPTRLSNDELAALTS